MGGEQRITALYNREDRSRNVYGDGGGNMFVSVRGDEGRRGGYRGRDSEANSYRAGRGRSRLPEGHWRARGNSSVSYRGGGAASSRRPPPPRYDDLLTDESREDRQRNRRMEMYRGGRGGGRHFRRGTGNYKLDRRPQYQQPSSGWHKFTIHECGEHDPAAVMAELTTLVGQNFDYHLLATEGNNVTFFFEDNPSLNKSLLDLSRRMVMPGCNQRLRITCSPSSNPPFPPPTEENLEKVKLLMSERYSAPLKRLDLTEFHKDERLRSAGLLFPLYVPSNLSAVGRLTATNVPDVTEVDLSRNKLYRLEAVSEHLKACAGLTRLYLSNNKLGSVSCLQKLRGLPITELSLDGNPLNKQYKNTESYISAVREFFPKLLVLDGKELPRPIGFEVDESEVVTPPCMLSFFCDEHYKKIMLLFLKQYYEVYDSPDRSPLEHAYCDDVVFSMTSLLPDAGPRAVVEDNNLIPNRNLRTCTDSNHRIDLLYRSRSDVMKLLKKSPATQHDLDSFVIDMPVAKTQLIMLTLTGVYRREGLKSKNNNIRSFQRTLVIVPMGAGFCIANEQIHVTLASYDQIKEAFKTKTAAAAAGPSTAPVAAVVSSGGLEPQQLVLVEKFSAISKMLPEYSKQCLEQNAWDFEKAGTLFLQLKGEGKIPPEYFKP
ncbi:Nuclear RNA export factor Tap RNA-binding domain [Trinorchestia longiramus]|nr:Nuclear RNA export factor Tap RNA-binding domain [Trinorchestia longiramus]